MIKKDTSRSNLIRQFFVRHWLLVILLLFVIATRLPYLIDGVIPFGFDHGKDSLAIFHMLTTRSPKFIGPWTSIPGLYFGPGWYYLLAPAYLISGFQPVSAVYVMVLLVLIQVVLAYKYFGKVAAVLVASAPLWMIISTSAWNPFPMTLITFLMLIIFQKVRQYNKLNKYQALGLGLLAGFGFHFSAAYAIFYPIAILIVLLALKPKFKLTNILWMILGLILPFTPQILFELRHDFVQSKAVVDYFFQGEPHTFSWTKVQNVLQTTLSELTLAFVPEQRGLPPNITGIIRVVFLAGLGGFGVTQLVKLKNKLNLKYHLALIVGFIAVPTFGLFFLHFNFWYVYAMMPVAVVLASNIIKKTPKWYQYLVCILLILTPIFTYYHYINIDKKNHLMARGMLPIKQKALNLIEAKAEGRPFASYHYVPDIYDFSYQYLYFLRAAHGKELPAEFSYQPNVEPYVVQKPDLLALFPQQQQDPELIFYIVEQPENEDFLQAWWGEQDYGEIIEEIGLSDEVKLYVAVPAMQD